MPTFDVKVRVVSHEINVRVEAWNRDEAMRKGLAHAKEAVCAVMGKLPFLIAFDATPATVRERLDG